MMLSLANHVVAAELAQQTILLDIRHGRYWAYPGLLRTLLADEGVQPGSASNDRMRQRLTSLGLVGKAPRSRFDLEVAAAEVGVSDWLDCGGQVSPWFCAKALWIQWQTARQLRALALEAIVGRLQARKARTASRPDNPAALASQVLAFRWTHSLIPPRDRCLMKAVALYDFLIDDHPDVTLVIGVRAAPFHAHAWVQAERLLLDDEIERIRLFKPILVV